MRLEKLLFAFVKGVPVVNDFTLGIGRGAFFSLLGPSGCGKTTLLHLIGGYRRPAAGVVILEGKDVTHQPPERRDIGMVFQNYALFPHLSARANVAFGLEMRHVPHRERERRVEAMLDRVGLSQAERSRRPRELSGGQQQRVALARALVIEPRVLLLDEPLANLDRHLREQLRGELQALQERTGVTTLMVTHDQEEALALADQVGVMLAGRLLQVDTPRRLYQQPCNPFVARFLGDANLLEVEAVALDTLCLKGGWCLRWRAGSPVVKGSKLMVRPEDCVLGPAAVQCPNFWQGRVSGCTFLGADQVVTVAVTTEAALRARSRPEVSLNYQVGSNVQIGIPGGALWVIPEPDPPGVSATCLETIPCDTD